MLKVYSQLSGEIMKIVKIIGAGGKFTYKWPDSEETFDYFAEYKAKAEDGDHVVKIGFGKRDTYVMKDRIRVLVLIDGKVYAEFLGADDFEVSGEVLSEIKVPGNVGEIICRYPEEAVPERYNMFNVEGLPLSVKGKGVHNTWAVVASIGDHKTLAALAGLRRLEKK